MNDAIKKFLNEEQDPKAIEKITSKLSDLLMKGENIGYIGVQKKPAITVFPDSIVVTNKRIIICKPKNLGLSMDFTDYMWDDVASTFVKENILGSEFTFTTKTDLTLSIDYIPKVQARKLYTFAKEQMDVLKNGIVSTQEQTAQIIEEKIEDSVVAHADIIIPSGASLPIDVVEGEHSLDKPVSELSQDELFEKLQNYKKLLDNGLILQSEYDALKREVLSSM